MAANWAIAYLATLPAPPESGKHVLSSAKEGTKQPDLLRQRRIVVDCRNGVSHFQCSDQRVEERPVEILWIYRKWLWQALKLVG